jgi:hypothetical protein
MSLFSPRPLRLPSKRLPGHTYRYRAATVKSRQLSGRVHSTLLSVIAARPSSPQGHHPAGVQPGVHRAGGPADCRTRRRQQGGCGHASAGNGTGVETRCLMAVLWRRICEPAPRRSVLGYSISRGWMSGGAAVRFPFKWLLSPQNYSKPPSTKRSFGRPLLTVACLLLVCSQRCLDTCSQSVTAGVARGGRARAERHAVRVVAVPRGSP